jgi:hypothetical protein
MKKNNRRSASRDRSIRTSKRDIQINKSRNLSPSQKKRYERKQKERRKIYRRRRILVAIIFFLIIFLLVKIISNAVTGYKNYEYPAFRDEVLEDIASEVYVSSTEGRVLTVAEKKADFEELFNIISKNYALDKENKEAFDAFCNTYEKYSKKIEKSKSDQDFFDIVQNYLDTLNNSRVKILSKAEYMDLLNYYKNEQGSIKSQLIQNPQVVDRYKRMISENDTLRKTEISVTDSNVLLIKFPDFNMSTLKEDMKNFDNTLASHKGITNAIIDLSDNSSLNAEYWNEFSKYLLHSDFTSSNLIFYRGDLCKNSLEEINKNPKFYKTGFVKNPSSKYPSKIDLIDKDQYMYYDEVSINLTKDPDYANRNISIILNDSSANEAVKFAKVLKDNAGAKLIKNSYEPENSPNDIIYNFPCDYFILEHSGLIVSLDSSFSLDPENIYLQYDQRINSEYPVEAVLSSI